MVNVQSTHIVLTADTGLTGAVDHWAQASYKGKRVDVEILTDTYKIRGTLFVPLAGEGGYGSRLSDLLNNSDKQFLALTNVKAEALPDLNEKWEAPFMGVNKNAVTMLWEIKD